MTSVSITIDVREREIIRIFDTFTFTIDVRKKALDMGDILVTLESSELEWVFERKTINDLAASIKDGRYREQKARLLAHYPPHRITYIVEGDVNWSDIDMRITASTFKGFVFNTLYRDGIHVMFVHNAEDTAAFVKAFSDKVASNSSAFTDNAVACSQQNAMMVKSRPRDNVTPDLCWRLMLSQIPGISGKLSTEVVKVWPSMTAFVRDLEPLDTKERIIKLTTVPLLGQKKAKMICDYVF